MTPGKDLSRAAAAAANLSGSGPLSLDDIARPAALVVRLRDPNSLVGTYLRRQFTAAGGLRTVVVAVLPLVAVWGAGAYGLGERLRTQLIVSAGAWAVLTILLYLDPNSSRQLAALRDALPHGKGKD